MTKQNVKALESNRIKSKKKRKENGATWHLITKKTEKIFVYMRGDTAVIQQIYC